MAPSSPSSVVIATTTSIRGGLWRHILELAGGLRERGLEVSLAFPPWAEELIADAEGRSLPWLSVADSLRAPADVWHMHLPWTFDRDALRAIAGRRRHGPVVLTEHLPRNDASDGRLESHHPRTPGAWQVKTVFKRVEYALVDRLILVSRGSAQFVAERYGLSASKVSVINNGIAPPMRETPAPVRGEHMRVVCVGRIDRQKGHDQLIEAAGRSAGDWQVEILGDGEHRPELEARVAEVAPGRVHFVGWTDEPEAYMTAADVVCMPSRWEAFPYVPLEAAALSRGTVGFAVDGLEEMIVDGVTGLLVPPASTERLAGALDRLDASPELCASLGRGARERLGRYSLDRMVEETADAYAAALRRRSRA